MTKNATGGPTIVYGQQPAQQGTNYVSEYNEDAAPSLFWGGVGLLDSRWGYKPDGNAGSSAQAPNSLGFQGVTNIPTVNAVPAALNAILIAASQTPTSGTALTLFTTSNTGLTVLSAALTVYPSNNAVPSGALVLDGQPSTVVFEKNFSASGGVQLYDPTKSLARCVTIRNNGNDGSGTYTVKGYDIYGYAMSEAITGGNSTTVTGKKAWKFVTSVTPSGTINSTSVAVGTSDVYGFPIRADGYNDLEIVWAGANITSSTGFTAAVTTAATSTTGDVRGTYKLQVAADGTSTLTIFETPRVANLGSVSGLFGVTQA